MTTIQDPGRTPLAVVTGADIVAAERYVPPEVVEYAVQCLRHGFSHPYASFEFADRNRKYCNCADATIVSRTVTRGPWLPVERHGR